MGIVVGGFFRLGVGLVLNVFFFRGFLAFRPFVYGMGGKGVI